MSAANGVFGWTGATTRPAQAAEYEGRHRSSGRVLLGLFRMFYVARHRRI